MQKLKSGTKIHTYLEILQSSIGSEEEKEAKGDHKDIFQICFHDAGYRANCQCTHTQATLWKKPVEAQEKQLYQGSPDSSSPRSMLVIQAAGG